MAERPPKEMIRLSVLHNLRGLICVGVMWGEVLGAPTTESAEEVLNDLPFEIRVYIRAIYAAQPSSLESSQLAGPLRDTIVRWCKADPERTARS